MLIEEKPDVLLVQRGPFVESDGGHVAYLLRDGIAVRTPIVLGATSLHAVEIRSGLKAGDKIIISGTELFEKNERITINQ
jgi:HlyD family secretion protein